MGWWVPFGWWRVLAMGGAILSLLLMVGFFGASDLPRSYHYHASTRECPSVEAILQNGDKLAKTGPVGSDQHP
jgi:hypothetical protein